MCILDILFQLVWKKGVRFRAALRMYYSIYIYSYLFYKSDSVKDISDFLSGVWFTLLTQMATAAILGCFRGIVHPKMKILLLF